MLELPTDYLKAKENYHRKSQFTKNGQTHRPHFNSRGQRYRKTQTIISPPQTAGESGAKTIALHRVSVSRNFTLVVSKTQTATQSAGRIKHHLVNWGKLTTDPHILNMVKGCKIEFDQPPCQWKPPCQHQFSPKEAATMENEIAKLVLKGVLIKSSHEQGEFLSIVF